ncbi:hypothetical protein CEP52_007287 [Fusarium oligoseptatum]|uniref:VWFA domain-containing protein n=1 Tax=Fusarium oligoseptatum TaxID=2604345 RepID=A0A428TNF5_9HYPO|nr:hypothetical protein CEP52_007287 [Fusarium oligoseptatum]
MTTRYLFLLIAINILQVAAFFPAQWKEDSAGNGGISHEDMTRVAFEDRAYLYFPSITTISSKMRAACKEIQQANMDVDDNQDHAHKHCDGESLSGLFLALPPDVAKARKAVGEALHTIQDFYSHSNWVELGNTEPNSDLIRNKPMGSYMATPDQRTCRSCNTSPKPPGWDSDWPIPCKGIHCEENTNGFPKLTSGYYPGEDVLIPGDWKCRHGGFADKAYPGINKDSNNCWWSPHSDLHFKAAELAMQATMQFFDDIKDDTSGAPKALRLLFGVPTLAFAIDTTGSMDDVIDAVRVQALQIAESLSGTDNEPGLYVLSPFNDPSTGPLTVTTDLAAFEDAISNLGAAGGGDCPELAFTGMLAAVDVMDVDSGLLLFTDADAKDSNLMPQLLAKAQEKRISISVFTYASDCEDTAMKRSTIVKRVDNAYGQLCAGTGGLYRTGPRSEVANFTSFIENVITTDLGTIIRVQDKVDGAAKEFDVPGVKLEITTPDGKPLQLEGIGITKTILEDSTYLSLSSPPPGTYKVTISGKGTFTFLSSGVSTLQLSSFNFASVRGRPGHRGWYPMAGQPPFGKDVGAIAEVDGSFKTADFTFRAPDFSLVSNLNATAGSGERGSPRNSSFFATVKVQRRNLLVYVSGEDDKGVAYQRALPAVVVAENSTVKFPNATVTHVVTATAVPSGPSYVPPTV